MASHTRVTQAKRRARDRKAGRKRKNEKSARSTPSAEEVFAEIDGNDGKKTENG